MSIIAEDLGIITPDVKEVMNKFGFLGMKVLLFGVWRGPADQSLRARIIISKTAL